MGKSQPTANINGYEYYQTLAVVVSKGPIKRIRRIWFDNDVVYDDRPEQAGWSGRPATADGRRPSLAAYLVLANIEVYLGTQTQDASPTLEGLIGSDDCPAYRGRSLVVFKDLPIHKFGGRAPSMSFEVESEGTDANGRMDLDDVVNAIIDLAGDVTAGIPGIPAANRDLSALAGLKVDGMVLSQRAEARQHLATLQDSYMFDFVDIDYKLTAVLRGGEPVGTIDANHLGAGTPDPQPELFQLVRGQQLETPQKVDVVYHSQAIDFQTFTQSTSREATLVRKAEQLTLPVVMTETNAMALARRYLAMRQLQRDTMKVALPWRYIAWTPGDVVYMPMPSGIAQRFKITKQLVGLFGHIEFTMVPDDPDIYTLTGDGSAPPNGGGGGVAEAYAPVIYAGDLNALVPSSDASFDGCSLITVVATARTGWPGAKVMSQAGIRDIGGQLQTQINSHAVRGTIGRLTGTLAAYTGPNVWDTTSVLTFQLERVYGAYGTAAGANTGNGILEMQDPTTASGVLTGNYSVLMLSATSFRVYDPLGVTVGLGTVGTVFSNEVRFKITAGSTAFVNGDSFTITVSEVGGINGTPPAGATDLDVLNGANVLVVGGEIVQYVSALDLGNDTYQLTRLLRGRRGTEYLARDVKAAGTMVALLTEDTALRFKANLSEVGGSETLHAFDVGKAGADYTNTPTTTLTLVGNARKPWGPGSFTWLRESDGDLILSWAYRSRWGDELANGGTGTVPLGETTEQYEVEVWDATFTTLIRTATGITSPTWNYTQAMQSADVIDLPADLGIKLFQVSPLVGRGHPTFERLTEPPL